MGSFQTLFTKDGSNQAETWILWSTLAWDCFPAISSNKDINALALFSFRSLTFEGMTIYHLEIAYTDILLDNTGKVWIWSRSDDIWQSYCRLNYEKKYSVETNVKLNITKQSKYNSDYYNHACTNCYSDSARQISRWRKRCCISI